MSLRNALLFFLSTLVVQPCAAQATWPEKPIRIVVPYPAGGATDQIARALQPALTELLKQPVIIENRAGAAGAIGMQVVISAPADGYTLYFGNNGPNAILPSLRKMPVDPLKDLKPISLTAIMPLILTVPADSPARTLDEFLAMLRSDGAKLNYGSVGNGSFSHLTGELFKNFTQTKAVHIPYNGGAPMMTAFGSGDLQYAFTTGIDSNAMMRSGKVRYLGVATEKPTPVVPGLSPVAERVPGFTSVAWFGLFAPAGVADAVISSLHGAIVQAVARPETREYFAQRNIEAKSNSPAEFDRMIRSEASQWAEVIKRGNISE